MFCSGVKFWHMNTKFFSFSFIVLTVALVGCTPKPAPEATIVPTPTPTQAPVVMQKEMILPQQRIAQAMANGTAMTCVITKNDSSEKITLEIKGKKSRAYGASLSGNKGMGYILNDGKTAYIWSEPDKKGLKMDLENATTSGSQQYEDFTKDEVWKKYQDNGYSYTCDDATFADSNFAVPKDVTFTDLSEMMKSINGMKLPSGMQQ